MSHYQDGFTSAESFIYEMAKFYLKGCPRGSIAAQLTDQLEVVFKFLVTLVDLTASFSGFSSNNFEFVCGSSPETAEEVVKAVATFHSEVCVLALSLVNAENFFTCDNWHPLYATAMYDTVCYEGNEGFAYIATTEFLIVFFAMIMLTLRVAFYDIDGEKEAEGTCYACCDSCRPKPSEEEATAGASDAAAAALEEEAAETEQVEAVAEHSAEDEQSQNHGE